MDIFEDYEVVARDGSNSFEFRHKGGAVLLTTRRISLDTLARLALGNAEARRNGFYP